MEPAVVPLDPAAIAAARVTIDPVFLGSPQFVHDGLSERAGRPVIVKVETVNPIRSFKGRGTWHAVAGLVGEGSVGADRPLVVASTGNFGQGVAYAARAFGVPVDRRYADEHANPRKLDRMRAFGATVRQAGHDFDAAREAAAAHARTTGAHLLVDGEDARIALGAGTLAVELTDAAEAGDLPLPATAYVPVGNGALIVGVGAWLRAAAAGCRIVGIQSEAAPSMTLSWRERRPIETETAATFADGIASRVPVPEALALDGRPGRRHAARVGGVPAARPGRARRRPRDHRRGGGSRVVGRRPGRPGSGARASPRHRHREQRPTGAGRGVTVRAVLPREPAAFARSILPLVLIVLAASVRETRLPVLIALAAGTVVAIRRDAPVRWAWAAPVPVALSLTFGLIVPPAAAPLGADCASVISPPAVWRLLEAVLVLGTVGLGAILLRAPASSLWLRLPSTRVIQLSVVAFGLCAVLGLVLGPALARPFFGSFGLDLSNPWALVPAFVFALSNGIMEEVAYRGALMGWSARVTGLAPALVVQALVFGLAHGGPDVIDSSLVLMLALGAGGLDRRLRSRSGRARCSCRSRSTSRSTCRSMSTLPAERVTCSPGRGPLAPALAVSTYGRMGGMEKTTVYLTEAQKRALERAARLSGRSEAELIREGIDTVTSKHAVSEPTLPLFDSGQPDLAERVDELLGGFGER